MPAKLGKLDLDLHIEYVFKPSLKISAAEVDKLGLDIRSFREPLKRSIQKVLAPSFRQNFDVGGRPPWEDDSPGTYVRKGQGKVLVETGALQEAAGQLNIWHITRTDASIRALPSRVSYGALHQKGFHDRGGGMVPARPFLVIQNEDTNRIEEVFFDWLTERSARSGFRGRL